MEPKRAKVHNFPEIVFGLVGALGSDLTSIQAKIRNRLKRYVKPEDPSLTIVDVKIIESLQSQTFCLQKPDIEKDIETEKRGNYMPAELEARIRKFIANWPPAKMIRPKDAGVKRYIDMLTGDVCRQKVAENLEGLEEYAADYCAMAMCAVAEMKRRRKEILKQREKPKNPYAPNTVYILHSLKHPDEVKALRAIYGGAFILVGVYKEEEQRRDILTSEMEEFYKKECVEEIVDYFMRKDLQDGLKKHGQNVRHTFPMADLFINSSAEEGKIRKEIDRFTELLFSDPRPTPTRDEYAMFHAYAASIRSSAPGRQVGAAITNRDGEVVCLGTNEVAKPGGGHYWYGEFPDRRAITEEFDPNTKEKTKIVDDLFEKLKTTLKDGTDLATFRENVKESRIADITEFDRTVHAEVSALSLASRESISVRDGTLYCTTFPCHLCAKAIIAAGIKRVVYVEPYPKSKAPELYPEAFGKAFNFNKEFSVTPFMGIGSRLFFDLFSVFTSFGREIERKTKDGRMITQPDIRLKLPTRSLSQDSLEALYLEKTKRAWSPKVATRSAEPGKETSGTGSGSAENA